MRLLLTLAALGLSAGAAEAGIIFGATGLAGGSRWDAAPRTVGGQERSLAGGLRFSLQGGSYQAYRDQFTWSGAAPTVEAFQGAVTSAFGVWEAADPVSGLASGVRFTPDLGTATSTAIVNNVRLGAEIDLVVGNLGFGTQANSFFDTNANPGTVTLTSGTAGYAGFAINGADITFNVNNAVYTLDTFRTILIHEIGHAIGLGDVDLAPGTATWVDDNYSGATSATALATLTNSWAALVNPLNPAASPLQTASRPANADPGVDTPGVNILMESAIPAELFGVDNPLQNDDYGTRQFLYPTPVPEPAGVGLAAAAALAVGVRLRRALRRRTAAPAAR